MYPSNALSALSCGEVFLKLESEQFTGSFKARGALNKVLALDSEEKKAGLITASTGNHAQGFARALSISGDKGIIFLPETAVRSKVEALRYYPIELEFFGNDGLETELHAKQVAAERGMVWVSPYNDLLVIAGQGTIGLEMLEQLDNVDCVLACIGGGGMMSGIASWLKTHKPDIELIGCLPENSPEMYLSVKKGEIVQLDEPLDTLSDGSAGGVEQGSVTFQICSSLVDDYILVCEDEIAGAIRFMVEKHHKIIEGAAGVAVAGFIKEAPRFAGKTVAIVVCGANIALQQLKQLL